MSGQPLAFGGSKCSLSLHILLPGTRNCVLFCLNALFPASIEYDNPVFEKSGKGGTYPRRYGIPFGLQDYSDGLYRHPDPAVVEVSLCDP